jgi:hypothetical protein
MIATSRKLGIWLLPRGGQINPEPGRITTPIATPAESGVILPGWGAYVLTVNRETVFGEAEPALACDGTAQPRGLLTRLQLRPALGGAPVSGRYPR